MTVHFRPAKREQQPLMIGLAGMSKSGKSLSALRLSVGLAGGGRILMLNTEPHGHHYADQFTYEACDLTPPHRPEKYTEALAAVAALQPAVVIIDTLTHLWDGLGGMLEWKDELALEMAKGDERRAEKMTAPAWARVKAAENTFVNTLLGLHCHAILTFRAKEKIKITKDGKWHDLGLRPIMSDRIAFETIFTLTLPAFARGVPDLAISDLRWPFAEMIPTDRPLDETVGETLAKWARGALVSATAAPSHAPAAPEAPGPRSGAPARETSAGSAPREFRHEPYPPKGTMVSSLPRTPVDEWEDQFDNVKTANQRKALLARVGQDWGTFLAPEQKRLADANKRAQARVGG